MFVRVTIARYDPAREEAVERFAAAEAIPAYRAQPGFQGYGGAWDREAGRLVVLTTWDTREHAQHPPGFLAKIGPGLAALGVALESQLIFEVTT